MRSRYIWFSDVIIKYFCRVCTVFKGDAHSLFCGSLVLSVFPFLMFLRILPRERKLVNHYFHKLVSDEADRSI